VPLGALLYGFRVIDVGDDCEGFRRARGPLGFRGYLVLDDDGKDIVQDDSLGGGGGGGHGDNCTTSVVEVRQSL
jgi:hypothetical protein